MSFRLLAFFTSNSPSSRGILRHILEAIHNVLASIDAKCSRRCLKWQLRCHQQQSDRVACRRACRSAGKLIQASRREYNQQKLSSFSEANQRWSLAKCLLHSADAAVLLWWLRVLSGVLWFFELLSIRLRQSLRLLPHPVLLLPLILFTLGHNPIIYLPPPPLKKPNYLLLSLLKVLLTTYWHFKVLF